MCLATVEQTLNPPFTCSGTAYTVKELYKGTYIHVYQHDLPSLKLNKQSVAVPNNECADDCTVYEAGFHVWKSIESAREFRKHCDKLHGEVHVILEVMWEGLKAEGKEKFGEILVVEKITPIKEVV